MTSERQHIDTLLASVAESLQQASQQVQGMREAHANREAKAYWRSALSAADAIGHSSRLIGEVGALLEIDELY